MTVYVLNGPNLNRLGTREPLIYGSETYADLVDLCEKTGESLGLNVIVRQSNHEGELIEWIHQAADEAAPVVLNAGAWTHTSIAIADACAQLTASLVEVHISNVHKREEFRHHSYISAHAQAVIVGMGTYGYTAALNYLHEVSGVGQQLGTSEITELSLPLHSTVVSLVGGSTID